MDWPSEKVLVVGGSGFLGANIVHFLVSEANTPARNIRVFSDRPSRALDGLPDVEQVKGDILSAESVTNVCKDRTLVFHAAGSTTFDPRLKRQQWLVNVEGTRNVLGAVRDSKSVRRLCYTSTVNVLGCPYPEGSAGTEESCNPYTSRPRLHSFHSAQEALTLADAVHEGDAPSGWWNRIRVGYFDSKLAAQELVNRASREGLDVVSVLPGTCFGPYGELGDAIRLIRSVMKNRLPGVPRGGMPLAHVHDVARGHVLAIEKGRPGTQYIVSGRPEDNRRYAELVPIIAEVVHERDKNRSVREAFPVIPDAVVLAVAGVSEMWSYLRRKPILMSRQTASVSRYALFYSSERAARELGYRAQKSFREGVEAMYRSLIS
jgi:dihydroflavonol-4-reductase